jgi:AcrR family transcriptional regulator
VNTSRQPPGHETEVHRAPAARSPSIAGGLAAARSPSAAGRPAAARGPQRARLLRRDAERNRQRILAAAAEVFTERGLDATLDDVARHAGVGVGTVYRRFPDKASLADALFDERIDALAGMAEQAQAQPDAWAALVWFLEHSAEMLTSDRGLRQILMFAAQGHDRVECARDRMRPAIDSLVKRAQADGKVRADLAATDIPIIEFMLAAVAEYAQPVRPAVWRRYLALMLDALRPAAQAQSGPLPEPELSPDEMVQVLNSNPLGRRLAPSKATVTIRP